MHIFQSILVLLLLSRIHSRRSSWILPIRPLQFGLVKTIRSNLIRTSGHAFLTLETRGRLTQVTLPWIICIQVNFARLLFYFFPQFPYQKARSSWYRTRLSIRSLARSSLLGHAFPFDHSRSALSRVLGRFPALLNSHRRRLSAAHCREQGQAHFLRVRRRHFPYPYVFRALYFGL